MSATTQSSASSLTSESESDQSGNTAGSQACPPSHPSPCSQASTPPPCANPTRVISRTFQQWPWSWFLDSLSTKLRWATGKKVKKTSNALQKSKSLGEPTKEHVWCWSFCACLKSAGRAFSNLPTSRPARFKVNNYTTNISSYSIILSLCNLATFWPWRSWNECNSQHVWRWEGAESCFFSTSASFYCEKSIKNSCFVAALGLASFCRCWWCNKTTCAGVNLGYDEIFLLPFILFIVLTSVSILVKYQH